MLEHARINLVDAGLKVTTAIDGGITLLVATDDDSDEIVRTPFPVATDRVIP